VHHRIIQINHQPDATIFQFISGRYEIMLRHPQHTQTSSNSSTIAAGSSNGVINTRRCRYSCLPSWWWVEVPPETCRAVSR